MVALGDSPTAIAMTLASEIINPRKFTADVLCPELTDTIGSQDLLAVNLTAKCRNRPYTELARPANESLSRQCLEVGHQKAISGHSLDLTCQRGQ